MLKNIINEAYAFDIGRKVKASKKQAMLAGKYVGGYAPYGYLKDPDNHHKLIIDPVTAPVVERVFEMFVEDNCMNEIAKWLNTNKIPSPGSYRKGYDKGTLWDSGIIAKILRSEIYTGDMVQGKTRNSTLNNHIKVDESDWIRVPDTHEAIISRETYAKAGERIKLFNGKYNSGTKRPYSPNIFRGKVYCAHCGGSMTRRRYARVKTGDVYAFVCTANSRKGRGSCIPYMINEAELESALLTTIKTHAEAIVGNSRVPGKEIDRQEQKALCTALKNEADKNQRMFKSLYESYVSGVIDALEYRAMRKDYGTRISDSLTRIAELETKRDKQKEQAAKKCELSDLIVNADRTGITAALVDGLIDRIRVFSDRSIEVDFMYADEFNVICEAANNG